MLGRDRASSSAGSTSPNGLTRTAIATPAAALASQTAAARSGTRDLPVVEQLPGRAGAGDEQPAQRLAERLVLDVLDQQAGHGGEGEPAAVVAWFSATSSPSRRAGSKPTISKTRRR